MSTNETLQKAVIKFRFDNFLIIIIFLNKLIPHYTRLSLYDMAIGKAD